MKNASLTDQSKRGAEGIPTENKNTTTQRHGLRKSVNLKCKQCIHDPYSGNGTWRQQVQACTSKTCPLYPVRPMPTDNTTGELIALTESENDHFSASVDSLEVVE